MIRIGLIEDNVFLAKSIRDALDLDEDFVLKFWAKNGQEALDKLEQDKMVEVLIMDIQMPIMSGIEATKIISQLYPHIKILVSTVFDDDDNLFKAIQAGAQGYLLKDETYDVLKQSILDMLDGGGPMSAGIASRALKLLRYANLASAPKENFELTKRETEILEQLCTGLNYQHIADNLVISPKTVRKHIENVYNKLNVHSKIEAVNVARRNRLI